MDFDHQEQTNQEAAAPAAVLCRVCGQPAQVRNVSGQDSPLCEIHYRQELALYNDFWSS